MLVKRVTQIDELYGAFNLIERYCDRVHKDKSLANRLFSEIVEVYGNKNWIALTAVCPITETVIGYVVAKKMNCYDSTVAHITQIYAEHNSGGELYSAVRCWAREHKCKFVTGLVPFERMEADVRLWKAEPYMALIRSRITYEDDE